MARRKKRSRKGSHKRKRKGGRKKAHKRAHKGKIPLKILERRLGKLARIVKSRGGRPR